MSHTNLILSSFVGGMIGFVVSAAYFTPKLNQVMRELSYRPPIMIVDDALLSLNTLTVGAKKQDIEAHFLMIKKRVMQFKEAGYLVISRQKIIASPDHLFLQPNEFLSGDPLAQSTK